MSSTQRFSPAASRAMTTPETYDPQVGRARRVLVMTTAILASSMYVTDLVTVAIALPHMQGTFAATPVEIAWVATAFILGTTAMIVCVGWVGAKVGVRRLFTISIAAFMALALLAANAESLREAVLWRFLMGVAGASVQPLAQVILLNTYPKEQYGRAIALWGSGVMIAPITAIPIAGYVIDLFGWPGVFYMALPTGGLALLGALSFVPRAQAEEPGRRLDWLGLSILVLGLASLQFTLSRGARHDWFESPQILVGALIAVFCAYAFFIHAATTREPLLSAAIFRHRNLSLGLTGAFVFGSTLTLVALLLALMLQNQLGYPVEVAALTLAPRAVGILIGQYLVAIFIVHMDPRHLIAIGAAIAATMAWIMSGWSLEVSPWQVTWALLVHGIGDGFIWMALNPLAVGTVPAHHRPQAVPLYYLSFNVGFSTGVAAILTYWAHSAQSNHALLTQFITPFQSAGSADLPPGWDPSDPSVAAALAGEISRQAAMIAYNNCFVLIAIGTLCIVPIAYLMRNPGWRPERR